VGQWHSKYLNLQLVVDCCSGGNKLPSGGDRSEDVESEMHRSKQLSSICNDALVTNCDDA